MSCRRPIALAVALAVSMLLGSVVIPAAARASTLNNPTTGDYVVSLPGGIPASTGSPQLIFDINPTGSVTPSVDTTGTTLSPLSIDLNPYVASNGATYADSGFDTSKVVVFLRNAPGSDAQQLGLSFANGVTPGGVVDFKLNKTSASTPDPTLTLDPTSPTQNVQIYPPFPQQIQTTSPATSVSSSSTSGSSGSSSTSGSSTVTTTSTVVPSTQTPEPVSLVLWSALTVAGLLRACASRRQAARTRS